MITRIATKEDARQIAKIHRKEIQEGFLSSLPPRFLAVLYEAIIESNTSFCAVVQGEDNQVEGFIAGTTNVKGFYAYFLKHYFVQASILLLPRVFRMRTIKRIYENLRYPQRESSLPMAELLTIAIRKEVQGQGIGGQMLEQFVKEMKKRKVSTFKVIVGENLEHAIRFYEKSGFKFLKTIALHDDETSRVYIYHI